MVAGDGIRTRVGRCATLVIAANDSSTLSKQRADYVCDGVADQVQIQAALDALPSDGGKVVLLEGNYEKGNAAGIEIPSNVEIELLYGATIKFADSINADGCIFKNSDQTNGNSNISIKGGVLDGNETNQTLGSVQLGIDFKYVSNSVIKTTIKKFMFGDVKLDNCYKSVECENLHFTLAKEEILFDFESLSPSNPTVSFEGTGSNTLSTDSIEGTNSIQLTSTASSGQYFIVLDFDPPIDLSNRHLEYWVKPVDKQNLFGPYSSYVKVYTDVSNNKHYWSDNIGLIMYAWKNNKWTKVICNPAPADDIDESTYGPWDMSNVERIKLMVSAQTAAGDAILKLDVLKAVPNFKRPILTLSFDDGASNMINNLNTMEKYEFPGIAYINGSTISTGGYLTEAQLQILHDDGWDIGSHLWEHFNVTTLSSDEINFQLSRNKTFIEHLGLRGSEFIATPYNSCTEDAYEQILKFHNRIRSSAVDFSVEHVSVGNDANVYTDSKLALDRGFKCHSMIDVWAHAFSGVGQTAFDTMCSYVKSLGMDVMSLTDVYTKYFPNRFTTPNYQSLLRQSVSDLLMDVLAVSTTHIRSNEDLSAATPITFTLDAQPDIPRTLSWAFDTHAQITEYDMEVIGIDAKGNTVTETWDETAGWSGETNNAFAVITSIKMTSRTGTGAGDTMDIGITDVLGLSNIIYETSDVFKIKKNNANATVATAQVNTTYDTYDMSVIGLGAGDDFTIWYKSNLNIIS